MADLPLNTLLGLPGQGRRPPQPALGPTQRPPMPMMPSQGMQQQRSNTPSFMGAGGYGADPNAQQGEPNFLDNLSSGFSNPLTQIGMAMISNGSPQVGGPRPMFAGVPQAAANAQTMQLRQQESEQQQADRETEKQRRAELSRYVSQMVPDNLKSLAAVDPESALTIFQQSQPAGLDPTDDMREYDAAVAQGYGGSFADWLGRAGAQPMTPEERAQWGIPQDDTRPYAMSADGPKVIGGGGQTINVGTGDAGAGEFWGTLGDAATGRYVTMMESGNSAARNLAQLDQLDGLLENTPQGFEAAATSFAGNFGIDLGDASGVQAAEALISQMIPAQRPPGSGPMSDSDLDLFRRSVVRLINQPGGNKLIMDTARAINTYDLQLARIVENYALRGQRAETPEQADALRSQMSAEINALQNPLENFNDRISGYTGTSGGGSSGSGGNGNGGGAPSGGVVDYTDYFR